MRKNPLISIYIARIYTTIELRDTFDRDLISNLILNSLQTKKRKNITPIIAETVLANAAPIISYFVISILFKNKSIKTIINKAEDTIFGFPAAIAIVARIFIIDKIANPKTRIDKGSDAFI